MADRVIDALDAAAANLQNLQLKAGFMEGATYPDGTPVPMVAAVNEYGDPARNQPPRSFFRNAIAEHEAEWHDAIERGLADSRPVDEVLNAVGDVIVGDIVQSISTLIDPPLSPRTIHARRSRKVLRNMSTKPLVDTKVMIRAVSHEVGEIQGDNE
ncbi:hypothetical protein [Aeromonas hydrophila]|uniref:hypothetical protein n=1 Tax=Aeromonas hydrophila TaxID=644 RepID=UPI00235FD7AD|nr:hypothetical protein [Aeromonas hydrophila]